MPITVGPISNSNYSLRWRQPYVSESLNRKTTLNPRGVIQGFKPRIGANNSQIIVDPDEFTGISLMQCVGRNQAGNPFNLTLKFVGPVVMDLAPPLSDGAGDNNSEFALVIRPNYVVGSSTLVEWELVRPAEFDAALLNDVVVVAFLRTDTTTVADPLAEVFLTGSARSRGTSIGWAMDDLMVEYAKMGAPSGDNDGQVMELLYDSDDAMFARWQEYIEAYGPNGSVSVEGWGQLLQKDRSDAFALQAGGLEYPLNPVSIPAGPPDLLLFNNGYLNISDGPLSDGHSNTSVRVGGYNASWYDQPNVIGTGNPLITYSQFMQWYPCEPGDQFVVQAYIKSGGTDSYPGSADPLIMQDDKETGLGAYWGGPSREFLDKIAQKYGTGLQGSEEVHKIDPEQGVTFSGSSISRWTLFREVFECPEDYVDPGIEVQTPRWFAPFWKFVLGSQGHILLAGIKVWRIRKRRATGNYNEYRLAHTADSNPLGEAGRWPAMGPGRFSGSLIISPQGRKSLGYGGADAQDVVDSVPWLLTPQNASEMYDVWGHSPNLPPYAAVPPTKSLFTYFENPVPSAIGSPSWDLIERNLNQKSLNRQFEESGDDYYSGQQPGIYEKILKGGMVLRAEPDPITNAYSDVRFVLGEAPDPAYTWSPYDFPYQPRWCVREDGSMEANLGSIPVQGAGVQAAGDFGGKMRVYRSANAEGYLDLLGQFVATAWFGGDDGSILPGLGNNAHKGYEAGRMEFTAPWHSSWGDGASMNDGPRSEWHLDLADAPGTITGIARLAESGGYPLMRSAEIWTLSAINTNFPGFGASTVFDLVVDDATAPDVDTHDGTSGAFLVRQMSGGNWPYIGGGMVIRRGATTEIVGPYGFRGDSVLSFYNSKAGIPFSFMAVDPWGCEHHHWGATLDTLPYVPGNAGVPCRPGGDTIAVVTMGGQPAAAIYNWMPTDLLPGLSANMRIDAYGRLFKDVTAFTEYHYYAPYSEWVEPEVGDCLKIFGDWYVRITTGAQEKAVIGLYMGVKDRLKDVQNSLTGEIASDYWADSQGVPIDWSQFVYDPDNPPQLIEPDPGTWPELVQVAAVGDNRVFEGGSGGTPILEGFNVVSEGGDIEIGDLLCTSSTPGKLMRQNDINGARESEIRNYTVGRAMQNVSFSTGAPSPSYGIYGILMCG